MNKIDNYFSALIFVSVACASGGVLAAVVSTDELDQVAANALPAAEHCDGLVGTFIEAFDCGDELFEVRFNALDGVGMDVGDGGRFTRVPRADLSNWSATIPPRATGPNAESCLLCHLPEAIGNAGDGAGPAALNVIRDPLGTAFPGTFIQRNTPHLFGMAGPQLLAEDMTDDLQQQRDDAIEDAVFSSKTVNLVSKGVSFGQLTAHPDGTVDLSQVEGVATDLIVRPFQWKGNEPTVRIFSRGAFHNELGMNPVELAGDNVDGDFDNVVNEITIADTTAMAVYLAGQPRPTSLYELDDLRATLEGMGSEGLAVANELSLPDLSSAERQAIVNGYILFNSIGCAECHKPSLDVDQRTFSEPSQNPNYREDVFPGGQNAVASGVDPNNPITFDITEDQPDNVIMVGNTVVKRLGSFEKKLFGRAEVRLYGDLKLHDMGPRLAENIDETGAGASVWMTKELWGLANTAPYLHDGRATTIEEAIIEHGGEAAAAAANFTGLSNGDQDDVLALLKNLVLFMAPE